MKGLYWSDAGAGIRDMYSEVVDNLSCWCCRNKNLKELKNMYHKMPDTWKRLMELQKEIPQPYYRGEFRLEEMERRFMQEEEVESIPLPIFEKEE